MNILEVNDLQSQHGWAEKVMYDIKDILEQNWHSVFVFWGEKETIFSFFDRYFSIINLIKTLILIRRHKIDVVHVHNCSRIISPSPIIAAKILNKKVVMTLHDFHFFCPKTWWILWNGKECVRGFNWLCYLKNCNTFKKWWSYAPYHFIKRLKVWLHRIIIKRNVDFFISPSSKLRDNMIKSLWLNPLTIIHLPNFINVPSDHRVNFTNFESNRLLYVGRISLEKWTSVLIKAIEVIVKNKWFNDLHVDIIWDGPQKQLLENLTKHMWLDKYIHFLWKVENQKLKKYYEQCCAVIIPSVCQDNNPLVAIEAMKFWRPIIASNIWWIPDLVKNNENWYLFEMWDYNDLAGKILKIVNNDDDTKSMWQVGFNKLMTEYNSDLFYNKLINIYT